MQGLRKICWPFPRKACFLGECKFCQESDYLVDLDRLQWMNSVLLFQIGNATLAGTFA